MKPTPLYSIGHGSRKADDFLALLQEYGITYLVDVRSKPFSRFHPQFNKKKLEDFLAGYRITYVFMGDELGGRPEDPSCYNSDGKVDFNKVKEKDFFKEGISRLKTAYHKQVPLAIMCSERDPAMCHRSRLIGEVLTKEGIELAHIDENGKIKDQNALGLDKKTPPDLFS